MYTIKDRVADALGAIVLCAAFVWLWAAASYADRAIVGF